MQNAEIKETLDEIGDAFDEFKKSNNDRVEELESKLLTVEKKSARPGLLANNSGEGSGGEGAKEFFNFATKGLHPGEFSSLSAEGQKAAGTDSANGLMVPATLEQKIVAALYAADPLIADAHKATTTSNRHVETFAKKLVAVRLAEGAAGATQNPEFNSSSVSLTRLTAQPALTEEFILSAGVEDIEAFVSREVGEAMGAQLGAEVWSGSGSGAEPLGVLNAPFDAKPDTTRVWGTVQAVTAATLAPTVEEITSLIFTMTPALRPGCKFYVSTSMREYMSSMKDGDGRFLFSIDGEGVSRFRGYVVEESTNMDELTASGCPLAFINPTRGITLAANGGQFVMRDPYTSPGLIKLYGRRMNGVGIRDSRAIKLLKLPAVK